MPQATPLRPSGILARTTATVRSDGVLGELSCTPPLTLRHVLGEPGECTLCLVGTTAGPLAGDDLGLHLRVEAGARARLIAAGASLAQGRGGSASAVRLGAALGAGASLDADPGAVVVAHGSRTTVAVTLELAGDAAVRWRELIVLGRTGDPGPGRAVLRWDVVRAGRPVLRQVVDSRDVGGHRVLAGAFVTSPTLPARTIVRSPTAVVQRIDARTVLATVLGGDAADVTAELDALLAEVGPAPS